MPQQVSSALRRLVHAIREFTIAQRTVAIIGVAVVILGTAALSMWAMRPSYTPLFSGLSGSDANAIVEQLRSDGVPYELANGGATILVPEQDVYDERLKAAAAGLPSSSTGGYSLLDKMGVTSSEFQQSVTYKRALEGELAATIQAMDGVKAASVQLAIPKETVFVSQKADPTASVFVQTENGVTLSTDQVQAIVHLTSASIEGMAPTDVAVIDAQGQVLSAVGVGTTGGAGKQASDYEQRVRAAVQSMLDTVVGPGNATVVVAADLSNESAQRTEESYSLPDDAPALNESTKTEEYTGGAGGGATGVLGPDNIAVPAGSEGTGSMRSESTTRNNAVNKVTESRTIPAGTVRRQTVSVALDAEAAAGLDVAGIRSLVAAAAGADTARGDEVTVETVDFSDATAQEAARALAAAEKAEADARLAAIVRTAIVTGGVVVAVALTLLLLGRRARSRRSSQTIDLGELSETRTALEGLGETSYPAAPTGDAPPAEGVDADHRRSEIEAFAGRSPQKAAELLRGLMDDRQPV